MAAVEHRCWSRNGSRTGPLMRIQAAVQPLAKPAAMEHEQDDCGYKEKRPRRPPPSDEALRLCHSEGIGSTTVFRARPAKPSFQARFRWHGVGDGWMSSPRDDTFMVVPAPMNYS